MIYSKKKGFTRVQEIWYEENLPTDIKGDVIRYKFIPRIPHNAHSIEELYTLLIDLSRDSESLLNEIAKNTRYEIKRARERDNLEVQSVLRIGEKNETAIKKYIEFFNGFAASKKRNSIGMRELGQFYESGNLEIRAIVDAETNEPISMHAYVISDGRARLYQSASHFRGSNDPEYRKKTGRANRLLHWEDILYYKNQGIPHYDFGGWYSGSEDLEKVAINQFKEAFGGRKLQEFSCIVPVTFIGTLSVILRKILRGN